MSMAELWQAGIKVVASIPYHFLKPILDRFDLCAMFLDKKTGISRKLNESDIEEVKTFFRIRSEAIKLHFDFFDLGGGLTSVLNSDDKTTTA